MSAVREFAIPVEFLPHVRFAEPLARHTSWHVGGPADVFYEPTNAEELARFLRALPAHVPCHLLGLGSNVLVRDGGLRGVVISLHPGFDRLERAGATRVHADAGVACARVARQCVEWLLGPAEFLAGIPGTVGGALAMNAGAWGGETWPHVAEADVIDRSGARRTRAAGEYRWGYRQVEAPAPGEWFLAARFEFAPQPLASTDRIRALLLKRRETQPIGEWSGGSTFTNPAGQHAAQLIETAGLKGYRVGGAVVSTKHANFLINEGTATADDIERLMGHVQAEVERRHGVRLAPEVRVVGERA
ncbi:MAG TPA: UDP-N-acetylmuramate dehydrogenase [Steroidobacteraceae bacterium]|nr:UDP-N-acetylmuramate dehydrogenase [Steroidobacteraceae bacterium]